MKVLACIDSSRYAVSVCDHRIADTVAAEEIDLLVMGADCCHSTCLLAP